MKINSLEECKTKLKEDWVAEYEETREEYIRTLPFSVIVEGDYLEYEMAVEWSTTKFGEKNKEWNVFWYDKIDYDYGLSEFFFKSKENLDLFKNEVDNFYSEINGKKWRTNGLGKIIDL